jgi:hypothetical protein
MSAATNRDRILQALRRASHALDDDQLSERAQVRPRQQVNQICRVLERDGLVRRYHGSDGKIVNEFVADPADSHVDGVAAETGRDVVVPTGDLPPGNSAEQRDAERVMLDVLGRQLSVGLEPARITVPGGARVDVDGADAARSVLVECWAHQGPPKAAQRHKVLSDAFKLTWIASTIYPRPRLILCLSDALAARPFVAPSKSWAAAALMDLGITVVVVDLPADLRERVWAAQRRQYR